MKHEFRIYGLPAPQGSKRHVGRGVMVESSKKVKPWRHDIMIQTRDQFRGQPLIGPLFLEIVFLFPRPKGHFRTGKYAGLLKPNAPTFVTSARDGDIDKLCRSTLDGLSVKAGGCVIQDDSLVVKLSCQKRYVTEAEGCGALIRVLERQYDSKRSSAEVRSNAQALVCV